MTQFGAWALPNGGKSCVERTAANGAVARALAWAHDHAGICEAETVAIAEIPAPTFHEGRRSEYVGARLAELGAANVHGFGSSNVAGRLGPEGKPGIALVAHLDTVFAESVGHTVTRKGDRLYGPGVGDNSAGVAGILTVLAAMRQAEVQLQRPVWFVGNVGEEGLGDLRGVRQAMTHLEGRLDAVLAIEGTMLGRLGHIAVGSRRLRVHFRGEGGHSWLDFGRPSAVHAAATAAAQIARLEVPADPRTSYNIGSIQGGDGVNVIAPSAEFVLDMRSVSAAALDHLATRVRSILDATGEESGIAVTMEEVGNRPAGSIARDHALVEICAAAIQQVGIKPEPTAGSTDANIPLSLGVPAVALGITRGGGIHSVREWVEIAPMRQGVQQLILVCAALCGARS